MPTRGRAEQAREVLRLLVDKCKRIEAVTFGIRADEDDKETIETFSSDEWPDSVKLKIGPRGRGFMDLHVYTNEIAEAYPADWFHFWDDDMYMESDSWDEIIRIEGKGYLVLYEHGISMNSPHIMHRDIYNCIGHYARHCAIDSYLQAITNNLKIDKKIGVYINHKHMKKEWPKERKDQNRLDREAQQNDYVTEFRCKKMKQFIGEDKKKIMEMLNE